MKLFCNKSGLEYHTNTGIGSGYAPHPIFSLSRKSLLETLDNRAELDEVSGYLFRLAILNQLPVIWGQAPSPKKLAPQLSQNEEKLITMWLTLLGEDHDKFPKLHLTPDGAHIKSWLAALQAVLDERAVVAENQVAARRMLRKEAAIESMMLKRRMKDEEKLASLVADWAAEAGEFSSAPFYMPDGEETTVRSYWKELIIRCWTDDSIGMLSDKVDRDDLADLIDWCETSIPHGSYYAHELMGHLRAALEVLDEFTQPASPEVESDRPEPKRKDFKTAGEYLKARVAWMREAADSITLPTPADFDL